MAEYKDAIRTRLKGLPESWQISADNANNNDTIYTCVPGILINTPDGVVINAVELYSKPSSENRPMLKMGSNGEIEILMDKGPKNNYK